VIDFKHGDRVWALPFFVLVPMLLVDTLLAPVVVKAVRSEWFESAPGVVLKSELGRGPGTKGGVDFDLQYEYTVNGRRYIGTEYLVQPHIVGNDYWRAAHSANPVGKVVTVYYDPANPDASCLVPGLRADVPVFVWGLLMFHLVVVGMWWGWAEVQFRWRAFDPALRRCVRETPDGWSVRTDPTTRFIVIAFWVLLIVGFAGGILAVVSVLVLDSVINFRLPWVVPVALWVVVPALAWGIAAYGSREALIFINEREGTLEFAHDRQRVTIARADLLGIDTRTEKRKSGEEYEVTVISLCWRDKFDLEQTKWIAEYDEPADTTALVDWLSERLGLPNPARAAV
jgi:hypothetical protein